MLELLKSLFTAIILVPVVMAIILGLIYGLGELFNIISGVKDNPEQSGNRRDNFRDWPEIIAGSLVIG